MSRECDELYYSDDKLTVITTLTELLLNSHSQKAAILPNKLAFQFVRSHQTLLLSSTVVSLLAWGPSILRSRRICCKPCPGIL